jgi:hypothetical protein
MYFLHLVDVSYYYCFLFIYCTTLVDYCLSTLELLCDSFDTTFIIFTDGHINN